MGLSLMLLTSWMVYSCILTESEETRLSTFDFVISADLKSRISLALVNVEEYLNSVI